MKILHTSDWHLGRLLHEQSLLQDQSHALDQVLDIIKKGGHDALIIAGDIFDRSIPPAGAVELFSSFLTEARSISDMPVIILPGNHDSAQRLSFCSGIMKSSGIFFRTDASSCHEPVEVTRGGERAHIYALPFLYPSTFDAHDVDERARKNTHDDAVAEALSRITPALDKNSINICAGHLFTVNGQTSDSERHFVGGTREVDPRHFQAFQYTALGHLHRPQKINERMHYSGSLLKYSFSESGDLKGVLSVDISPDSLSIESLPLSPLRDMVRLRGSFTELMRPDKFSRHKNDYIEAELTDAGIVVNAISTLRERFPHILSVRQTAPVSRSSEGIRSEVIKENRTITDDYQVFHSYIHGEDPGEEKMELLAALHGEAAEQ